MKESLIVYGARCSWWDGIDRIGKLPQMNGHSLPCCPHCNGMLFQMPEDRWNKGIEECDKSKKPGYQKFMQWLRGKCFPNYAVAMKEYGELQ